MGLANYQMLVDGKLVDASSGERFESIDPNTNQVWATFPNATEADVDKAVRAAQDAFTNSWSTMLPSQRGKHLLALGNLLAENSEKLGIIETKDTGKLFAETKWQAKYIADYFAFFAGAADKVNGETLPIDKPDMLAFTLREPIGVVAAIIPWNSQLFLTAVKIAPALAAGNTVVLKASEHAAAPLLEFGKLVSQAGIPDGVINIITGFAEPCGRALTSHKQVARVSFTGGEKAAAAVIRNTACNFAELSLELGGKSPFIVFDDANIDSAVNGAVSGIFAASGQSCVAGSRLLLQNSIADTFLRKLAEIAGKINIGDPMDESTQMGPLCTQAQIDNIENQIALAKQQGAQIISGGNKITNKAGNFFSPTIVDCPSNKLDIVNTELFGPVISVLRFDTEEEAMHLANDNNYGLAAGVFTSNSSRSIRMAKQLRAGIVWINTYRVISPIAEFGGVKHSGYGREGGLQAVYDYTRAKTVWINTSNNAISNPFKLK